MQGKRNPFVAREGLPFLAVALAATILLIRYYEPLTALLPAIAFVFLYLLFRDPIRDAPSVALGVVSPVDGKVAEIEKIDEGETGAPAYRLVLAVNGLGTYTARSPVEGKIMDSHSNVLWVQTDEGDDVLLKFSGHRMGVAPKSFVRFGERLGQGQRCAYLRLTRFAEVQIPIASRVLVEKGQIVAANTDIIATVPVPR